MLKSNSRAAKTAIRGYIIDYLRNHTDIPDEMDNPSDSEIVHRYRESVLYQLKGINYPTSDFEKIRYDLNSGGWECGTYARRMMLKDWLQENDTETWRFSDTDVDDKWTSLVAREVLAF